MNEHATRAALHPAQPGGDPFDIVLAFDGSAGADVASELVVRGSWPPASVVHVVSAVGDISVRLSSSATPREGVELGASARRALEIGHAEIARQCRARRLGVDTVITGGRPADAILEAARAARADLTIVGSRGLGLIASLLLGSVSAEVVLRSPGSVLVVRRPAIERIVLATDGSGHARVAERLVARWPLFREAQVVVVGIDPQRDRIDADDVRASGSAGRAAILAASRLRWAGLAAIAEQWTGDAAAQILRAAEATEADTVVLAARGNGARGQSGLGSVARNVVTAGPSVLVVRRSAGGGRSDRQVPA